MLNTATIKHIPHSSPLAWFFPYSCPFIGTGRTRPAGVEEGRRKKGEAAAILTADLHGANHQAGAAAHQGLGLGPSPPSAGPPSGSGGAR